MDLTCCSAIVPDAPNWDCNSAGAHRGEAAARPHLGDPDRFIVLGPDARDVVLEVCGIPSTSAVRSAQ